MRGRTLLLGTDVLVLAPPELLAVLTTIWMDWNAQEEEVRKAHHSFIAQLAKAATPTLTEETAGGTADNPFPGVMRGSALGTVGKT